MMSTRAQRLAALSLHFEAHSGVAATRDLRSMQFTKSAVHRLVEDRLIVPLLPGVYRSTAYPDGPEQLMAAVCAADESAAIGVTTAGRHFGYRRLGSDTRVHALVPHSHNPAWPSIVVHRCRSLPACDITLDEQHGIRYTSPPRTVVDCAGVIGRDASESIVEQVLRDRSIALVTLVSTVARLWHPGRPGPTVLRDVLQSRPAWRNSARSDLERRMRAAIEARGLPVPEVNQKVVLPSGEVIEVDLRWPAWSLAGEVDHPFWHDGAGESHRDKRRDRKLLTIGIETMRFTNIDVDHCLGESLDDLEAVLRRHGWPAR